MQTHLAKLRRGFGLFFLDSRASTENSPRMTLTEKEQQLLDEARRWGFVELSFDAGFKVAPLDYTNPDVRQVYQGDLGIEMIDPAEMPDVATLSQAPSTGTSAMLAHSESGHHHVADAFPGVSPPVLWDTGTPELRYMRLAAPTPIRHLKDDPNSQHKTIILPAGTYKVRRQTETLLQNRRLVED